jgi:Tfp pilus assembly protein PilX
MTGPTRGKYGRRLGDDGGFTMIAAVLISVAVFILGAAIIQIAVSNSTASGNDRRRLQAVDAAEAGVDYYLSQLQSVALSSAPCSVTKTLGTTPASSFTVTPTFYTHPPAHPPS